MNNLENKMLKYSTEIKILQDSIYKLNPDFSLCDILVCYHGKNSNKTNISKKLIESKLYSIYGIPIVGEWIRTEEDQNKETWGTHGGRIIIDDSGVKYEQTTKPFGFVTKEAQENASWITIVEKNGHTENEYLLLKKCILWNQRYEECNSILEKNYGQSMELSNIDGKYTDDGYLELTDFTFSALCILGDHCPPCFESACISGHNDYSEFKKEYKFMLDQYKKFNLDSQKDSNLNIDSNNKQKSKEEKILDEKEIFAKLKSVLSQSTYRHLDKHYEKYIYLFHEDGIVSIVDREDCYKVYNVPFLVTKTEDELIVSIDFDKKELKSFIVGDKTDNEFNFQNEVEVLTADACSHAIATYQSAAIIDLEDKLSLAIEKYNASNAEVKRLTDQLSIFEKEKEQFSMQKRKESIDCLIGTYNKVMPKCTEYLEYCLTIEDSKDKALELIEKELTEIYGRFMLSNRQSTKFSAIEANVIANQYSNKKESSYDKYGELLDL